MKYESTQMRENYFAAKKHKALVNNLNITHKKKKTLKPNCEVTVVGLITEALKTKTPHQIYEPQGCYVYFAESDESKKTFFF